MNNTEILQVITNIVTIVGVFVTFFASIFNLGNEGYLKKEKSSEQGVSSMSLT